MKFNLRCQKCGERVERYLVIEDLFGFHKYVSKNVIKSNLPAFNKLKDGKVFFCTNHVDFTHFSVLEDIDDVLHIIY